MKYYEYFDRRKNTFSKTYELILKNYNKYETYNIVELGTSRSFTNGNLEGCLSTDIKYWEPENPEKWDWGAGIFTKVFSTNLDIDNINYKLYSLDPNDNAIHISKTMIGNNKNVKIIKDYSTNFLKNINSKIDLLYMDHMESGEDASIKHLEDSKIIIENNLINTNGIILIDDVDISSNETKGKYSIPYLLNNGFTKIIHEYQAILIKN